MSKGTVLSFITTIEKCHEYVLVRRSRERNAREYCNIAEYFESIVCSERINIIKFSEYLAQCFVHIKRKCNILIFTFKSSVRVSITRCVNS